MEKSLPACFWKTFLDSKERDIDGKGGREVLGGRNMRPVPFSNLWTPPPFIFVQTDHCVLIFRVPPPLKPPNFRPSTPFCWIFYPPTLSISFLLVWRVRSRGIFSPSRSTILYSMFVVHWDLADCVMLCRYYPTLSFLSHSLLGHSPRMCWVRSTWRKVAISLVSLLWNEKYDVAYLMCDNDTVW